MFIECTACYRADGPPELRTLGETEFVNGIAAMSASGGYGPTRVPAGIVGLVDLTIGARAEEVLRAHMAAAGPRFKGIRHAAAWEDKAPEIHNSHTNPPPHLYRDHAKFREGFAALGRLGLTLRCLALPPADPGPDGARPRLPGTADRPRPRGRTARARLVRGQARRDLRRLEARHLELAGCPNVYMKLGGLGMRINGFKFHHRERPPSSKDLADAWRPYIDTCIEAFGAKRCMFESNFPVDKISGSYAVYWNAFKRLASGASAADKAALFRDTARGFYRLS